MGHMSLHSPSGGTLVPSWARLLIPLIAVGAACASVSPAAAGTVIAPPTISAPLGGNGPYPVGTPVTFTFSEQQGLGAPVAYQYTLNGSQVQTVQAPSGTVSVQITPTREQSELTAYAVAADGTVSGGTVDIFYAVAASPAADHDMNGDGLPDLLTVGGTAGLGPGLWLAAGEPGGTGQVAVPATDIGINGNGFNIPGSPTDFNGAQAITGGFTGDGFQDVLIYYTSGDFAGEGAVLPGQGDGSAFPAPAQQGCFIPSVGLADSNGDSPLQVVNAYQSLNGSGLPDLLATSGDASNGYYLAYYGNAGAPCTYFNTFIARIPSPDGTADWNHWTLATTSDARGAGMFLWNNSTGALYLWDGLQAVDNGDGTGHLSYTQYLIARHWQRGVPLATLEAADLNSDGVPDLWAVTPQGTARAYLVSGLSAAGPAEIEPQEPQQLS